MQIRINDSNIGATSEPNQTSDKENYRLPI